MKKTPKVEKGIPFPSQRERHRTKTPWRQMAIGDSMLFPLQEINRARTAAAHFSQRNPEFKFKSLREGPSGDVRIWRVEV